MRREGIIPAMIFLLFLVSCNPINSKRRLPILGNREIVQKETGGSVTTDTIYHTIADFSFINQDSAVVTNNTFDNKIYVADFFFTTCPTICPLMKAQMLRVYETFIDNNNLLFLSHTIDPDHDTVAVLRDFASRLGVTGTKWHFVTGPRDEIYKIGQTSYMVTATQDNNEPGGYLHSGHFILVDPEGRIRGAYDGTNPTQVDRLINDIKILLAEYGFQ